MRTLLSLLLSLALSFALRAEERAPAAARLLPPETFVFAELHDVQRSLERLRQSSWGELAREPEVRELLGKLVGAAKQDMPGEVRTVLDEIKQAGVSGGFFAMTEMPDLPPASRSIPKMLIGVSYRGEPQRMEALLQRIRGAALADGRVKQSKETVGDTQVETLGDSGFSVSFAHADRQVLLSTDKQTLLDALARRAGNGPRSLADTDEWKQAEKEALQTADLTGFFSYDAFVKKLATLAGPDGAALGAMREFMPTFFSVSTKLDGLLMRERAYMQSRIVLPRVESKHHSLAFTGADTFAYLETTLASAGVPFEKLAEIDPTWKMIAGELQKEGLTVADITQTFGAEIAVVSDWESGALAIPTLFIAAEVRDAEKARKFATLITRAMESEGRLIEKEHRGVKLWTMKGDLPLVQPTLALSGTHLMFGLNPASVTAALDHAASGKSALAGTAAFTGALGTVGDTNAGLAYADPARLTERLYERVRPFIANAIAGSPQLSRILDASMLPKVETLARHMPPFIAGFHSGERGFVIESTGPVSYVTGVGGVGMLAGLAVPFFWLRAEAPAVPRPAPRPKRTDPI